MSGDAVGGNDTLIGRDNGSNILYGDADYISGDAVGGNDTLIGGNSSLNSLSSDALSMTGNAVGGNDTLIGGYTLNAPNGENERKQRASSRCRACGLYRLNSNLRRIRIFVVLSIWASIHTGSTHSQPGVING